MCIELKPVHLQFTVIRIRINVDKDPDPESWILTGNKMNQDPDPGHFFKIYGIFFNKAEFSKKKNSIIFMLKLDEPFRNQEFFIIFLFLIVQIWDLRVNKFFWLQLLVDIPDPGSQNLADTSKKQSNNTGLPTKDYI